MDSSSSELQQLDRARQSLVDQLDSTTGELKKLQTANSSLQKERDQADYEKEDLLKDLERQNKEIDRW